jgi:3-oxoadipate enol-lactonase
VAEVEVDGACLSYTVEGRAHGPVLLLSNALGTTRGFWNRQMLRLSESFRVVRYDTRGHGQSSAPDGPYTLDRLGQDAVAVLDAVGASRAHVCGLSLGGMTAMWLAVHAPDRVGSIVLANTAARIGTREYWQERIDHVWAKGFSELAQGAPPRWFTEGFRRSHDSVVAFCQTMLLSSSKTGYTACCAVLRDGDLGGVLHRVKAAALVITGSADPVTPSSDGAFLHEHIPDSRRIEFASGHFSNLEAGDAFTIAVSDFLSE